MKQDSIFPNYPAFLRLAKQGNLIPVYAELLADLETPMSSFLKICQSDYAFLLESVEEQEKIGRYSFLASEPSLVFSSKGRRIEISEHNNCHCSRKLFTTKTNPFDEIKKIMRRYRYVACKGLPRFCGGFVGYIAYDMVRFFEKIPDKNKDDLNLPDSVLLLTDNFLVFDHIERSIKIIANAHIKNTKSKTSIKKAYDDAVTRIKRLKNKLQQTVAADYSCSSLKSGASVHIRSNMTKDAFKCSVLKAKEHIRRGDIIQVVLSQRFETKLIDSPIAIYRRLRSLNPSPYMFYLQLKDIHIIGSSPEMLIRCEGGTIETRPIAGTRPRGRSESEDTRLAGELLEDKKERAEHLMLVDLGRNDLGRVAVKGSVRVQKFMSVEKYSHVMHIVSSVVAKVDKHHSVFDVLASAFPAGTVAGAPKIRAMEIIDGLENVRRGPYAGCVGYFSFSGNLDTCITIRTIIVKAGTCYVQAGAGIVADSVPEREFKETQHKAEALLQSILRKVK